MCDRTATGRNLTEALLLAALMRTQRLACPRPTSNERYVSDQFFPGRQRSAQTSPAAVHPVNDPHAESLSWSHACEGGRWNRYRRRLGA